MKTIKLAVLAICLLMGMVGAYGTSKKRTLNQYWAVAGTEKTSTQVVVASSRPSPTCGGGSAFTFICSFASEEELLPTESAWVSEITLISTYGN